MHRLELTGIEKRFGDRTAVRSTNICLENGVYGLLGENGAGKTTLMRMICGILKPDKGNIRCDGMDIRRMGKEYRGLLGYLPQDFGYYGDFSVWRFLHYMAALKALPEPWAKQRIEELLELEEELLEDAWDDAREDAVLSRVPAGLRELLKCIGIHPASVRDAIVEGGYEF